MRVDNRYISDSLTKEAEQTLRFFSSSLTKYYSPHHRVSLLIISLHLKHCLFRDNLLIKIEMNTRNITKILLPSQKTHIIISLIANEYIYFFVSRKNNIGFIFEEDSKKEKFTIINRHPGSWGSAFYNLNAEELFLIDINKAS